MNGCDERQFSARLSAVLDDHNPGLLPFEAVMAKGKAVKTRRRAAAILTALAVVAAVVTVPELSAALTATPRMPRTVPQSNQHVSVYPPGKGSKKGEVATGKVGKLRWTMAVTYNPKSKNLCFTALAAPSCDIGAPQVPSPRSGPPLLEQVSVSTRPIIEIWSVRPDVARVSVSLTSGQTVTLHPVAALGRTYRSFVALGAPSAAAVAKITAYSADGEIAYAIPFTRYLDTRSDTGGGADILTPRWLSPARQPRPASGAYSIGVGTVNGRQWAELMYVGPWGTCVNGAGYGGACFSGIGVQLLHGRVVRKLDSAYVDSKTGYVAIVASHQASTLQVQLASGKVSVPMLQVAGARFGAFVTTPTRRVLHWSVLTAAGVVLGGGR